MAKYLKNMCKDNMYIQDNFDWHLDILEQDEKCWAQIFSSPSKNWSILYDKLYDKKMKEQSRQKELQADHEQFDQLAPSDRRKFDAERNSDDK